MKTRTEGTEIDHAESCMVQPDPWFSHALHILESDLTAELSMADVAASVNLSKAHFFGVFRRYAGCSPHQWRLKVRIAAAQVDLVGLPLRMAEIAHIYGFSDQAHFTRTFRKIVGETPSSWRAKKLSNGRWHAKTLEA